MKCSAFLRHLDLLDQQNKLDRSMAKHLASCANCRSEFENLSLILTLFSEGKEEEAESIHLVDRVMAELQHFPPPERSHSYKEWVLAGFVISLSIVLVPVIQAFRINNQIFGLDLEVWLAIFLGLGMAGFGAFFIASHMKQVMALAQRFGFRFR